MTRAIALLTRFSMFLAACGSETGAPLAPAPSETPAAERPAPARLMTLTFIPSRPAPVPAGSEQAFVVYGVYSDGSHVDLTEAARWSSSDAGVAAFADPGVVVAGRPGTVQIVASVDGVAAAGTLTVAPPALYAIELSPGALSLAQGRSARLSAVGLYTDDSRRDLSGEVAWSSSDPAVARVDVADGVAIARAAGVGAATIEASLDGVRAAISVACSAPELVALGIQTAEVSLVQGESRQLAAFAVYSDGSARDVTALVAWSSSDTGVLDFDPDVGGLAIGRAPGWAAITAALGGRTATAAASVSPSPL